MKTSFKITPKLDLGQFAGLFAHGAVVLQIWAINRQTKFFTGGHSSNLSGRPPGLGDRLPEMGERPAIGLSFSFLSRLTYYKSPKLQIND